MYLYTYLCIYTSLSLSLSLSLLLSLVCRSLRPAGPVLVLWLAWVSAESILDSSRDRAVRVVGCLSCQPMETRECLRKIKLLCTSYPTCFSRVFCRFPGASLHETTANINTKLQKKRWCTPPAHFVATVLVLLTSGRAC